ncbi:MAG: MoxR family ATPase [Actinomycetia bacterium]|nr:MoxR family ATPase [Actinomycetes bacterium]
MNEELASWYRMAFNTVLENVERIVKGKPNEIGLSLVCLFAEGHLLLEDVPGTGKTSLAKSIANSFAGTWSRVQFTPDLLPADVTGGLIYNQAASTFEFRPGPIFSNVVLADEINRASPKTQAALLEVMEEQRVTIGNDTHPVPRPFVVIATQNPVEQEGTYRLPEAQLDRFLMRISLGYPDTEHAVEVLRVASSGATPDTLTAVLGIPEVQQMVELAKTVHVDDAIYRYMVSLTEASRTLTDLRLGVSMRGALGMMKASRVLAAAQGRGFVTVDDVKVLAPAVMGHRMLLTAESEFKGLKTEQMVQQLLDTVEVPAPGRAA